MRMRRLLVIPALLLVGVAAAAPVAFAQEPWPHHEDPATTPSDFSAASLLLFFAGSLDLLISARYSDTAALLDQLRHAKLPRDLRFMAERYVELLQSLNQNLAAADGQLRTARALLLQGQRGPARTVLDSAAISLSKAQTDLKALQEATVALGRFTGATRLTEGPLSEVYRRLRALLASLETLYAQYFDVLQKLQRGDLTLEKLPELPPLPVISGTLVSAPPVYPSYPVSLTLDAPATVHPGRAVEVSGTAASPEGPPLTEAVFRLLLDRETVDEFRSALPFRRTITLPSDLLEGQHALTLQFPAQGQYAAALVTRAIQVARVSPRLDVQAPGVALLPRGLEITGSAVSSLGPVANAPITVALGDETVTLRTDDQGGFSHTLRPSLTGSFFGPQALRVTLTPLEPWHSRASYEGRVLVVNVLSLVLLVATLVYLTTMLTLAWRRRAGTERLRLEPAMTPALGGILAQQGAGPQGLPLDALHPTGDGPRVRVVRSYLRAAQVFANSRAVALRPSSTLRDFLRAASVRVGSAFGELTSLAERALYRTHEPAEAEAARAEDLEPRAKGEA